MNKPMLGLVSHHENQESTRDKIHNHTEGSHLLQDNQEQVEPHYAHEKMNLSAYNFCVERPNTPRCRPLQAYLQTTKLQAHVFCTYKKYFSQKYLTNRREKPKYSSLFQQSFSAKMFLTLSPFATKQRIHDFESKIQLIYFLTTVMCPNNGKTKLNTNMNA